MDVKMISTTPGTFAICIDCCANIERLLEFSYNAD